MWADWSAVARQAASLAAARQAAGSAEYRPSAAEQADIAEQAAGPSAAEQADIAVSRLGASAPTSVSHQAVSRLGASVLAATSAATAVRIAEATMHNTFFVNYLNNDDFQLAQLPYKDNELSMVIILPKKADGLPAVEKKLSSKMLEQALAKAEVTNMQISLPKFKMTEEFSLSDDLSAMGMKEAFIAGVADFTGMQDNVSRRDSLYISKVIHKAFVDVNEEGTEAAAATAVVMEGGSAPRTPIPFKADHPFMFVIRHNATGSILFMGRVNDPRG